MYKAKIKIKVKADTPVFIEGEEEGVIATGEVDVKDINDINEAISVMEVAKKLRDDAVEIDFELLQLQPEHQKI